MIIANWKMNALDAFAFFAELLRTVGRCSFPDVFVAPPALIIRDVGCLASLWQIEVLSQNVHQATSGAFTGELSIPMMKKLRAYGTLLGHSERRTMFNETDQALNEKLIACQQQDFQAVLCIGESAQQRQQGETLDVLKHQLSTALNNIDKKILLAIAYEPIWAIGTGNAATPTQVQETHRQIKDWCTAHGYHDVPVLYGGSVKADNAESLLAIPGVDGLLVGGASLDCQEFIKIIQIGRK